MFSFFRKKAPSPAATAAPPAGALIGSALVAPIEVPEAAPAAVERERWIDKLKSGLRKTGSSISAVFCPSRRWIASGRPSPLSSTMPRAA